MGVFEIVGEICTIDSWYFKGWRFLFSSRYRRQANLELQALGPVKASLAVLWTMLHMALELALLGFVIYVILSGTFDAS